MMDGKSKKIGELSNSLFDWKSKKTEMLKQIKGINQEIEFLTSEILSMMEEEGITRIESENGSLSKNIRIFPTISDIEIFVAWCVENSRIDMIQKRCNSAAVNEYFECFDRFPEGIDSYLKTSLNSRKK